MKNSKIIVIDKDGNINCRGDLSDLRHSLVLLQYLKEKYGNWNVVKHLDYRVMPIVMGTLLTYMGNMVFLNTTKNNILNGILLIGDDITEEQIVSLNELADDFKNYNIKIIDGLKIIEGEAVGKDFYMESSEDFKQMLKRFFKEKGIHEGKSR